MHLMRLWDELTGVKPHTILLICLPLSFRGTTPCKSLLQSQLSAMTMYVYQGLFSRGYLNLNYPS